MARSILDWTASETPWMAMMACRPQPHLLTTRGRLSALIRKHALMHRAWDRPIAMDSSTSPLQQLEISKVWAGNHHERRNDFSTLFSRCWGSKSWSFQPNNAAAKTSTFWANVGTPNIQPFIVKLRHTWPAKRCKTRAIQDGKASSCPAIRALQFLGREMRHDETSKEDSAMSIPNPLSEGWVMKPDTWLSPHTKTHTLLNTLPYNYCTYNWKQLNKKEGLKHQQGSAWGNHPKQHSTSEDLLKRQLSKCIYQSV